MSAFSMSRFKRLWMLIAVLGVLLCQTAARADVSFSGDWQEAAPKISLNLDGVSRSEALKQLAKRAKWSIVVQSSNSEPIDLHVDKQPADKVLELILRDGNYLAKRDGDLISIERASASQADPAPATPSASAVVAPEPAAAAKDDSAPAPAKAEKPAKVEKAAKAEQPAERGEDRLVTGGSTRVNAGEVVKDLVVMGGSAEVLGTVTGDVAVFGGSVRIRKGARVYGDATAIGGSLSVDDGARVDGDLGAVGGNVKRAEGAEVGGDVNVGKDKERDEKSGVKAVLSDVGEAISRTALLFVFGAVLLALATRRMDTLEVAVARRPMRNFALGIVGLLASIVVVVALCVTVVGIPIAILAVLAATFGGYAAFTALLTAVGAALVRHKTDNPYIHLALGCALYLVLSSIPYLGGVVTVVALFISLGVLVATRGAGLFTRRRNGEQAPDGALA